MALEQLKFIVWTLGIALLFYGILRVSRRNRRELAKIATFFNSNVDWSGTATLPWQGQLLNLYFVFPSPRDPGRRYLEISWEVPGSAEWYLFPSSAKKYVFSMWTETIFEQNGKSWVLGRKQGDVSKLENDIKPKMTDINSLFCREFSMLKVSAQIQVSTKGIKRVTLATFQGLPVDCFENPSSLIPYFDQLPPLVTSLAQSL